MTVHVPAPSPVITDPLIEHGPDSLRSTEDPEAELVLNWVLEPVAIEIGRPGPHAPLGAETEITSAGLAPRTLIAWDTAPVGPPAAVLENWVVIV